MRTGLQKFFRIPLAVLVLLPEVKESSLHRSVGRALVSLELFV